MTFQEIFSVGLTTRGGVQVIMETVFKFSQKEIAWIDFAIDSQLGVRHQLSI
jgi:hypothetical protein